MAPLWSWAVGPSTDERPNWELASISARSLKIVLNDVSTASFTINGDSADAPHISPGARGKPLDLATDMWIARNGVRLFRGRITGASDNLQETSYTVGVTASTYEALLDRKLFLPGTGPNIDAVGNQVFAGADQSDIVSALITYSRDDPSDSRGTYGPLWVRTSPTWAATGVLRNITFPVGSSVWAGIKSMISMSNGFDWFLDTDLVASITPDHVGVSRGADLSYGGNVTAASGSTESSNYLNGVYMSGGTIINSSFVPQPVAESVSDIASRPEGRWQTAISDPVLTDSASVQSAADYYIQRYGDKIQTTWSITMTPGSWGGPAHIWVNDIVNLSVHRGRLWIDVGLRVYELDITVDQSGVETVSCTLGAVDNNDRSVIKALSRKLNTLAKS